MRSCFDYMRYSTSRIEFLGPDPNVARFANLQLAITMHQFCSFIIHIIRHACIRRSTKALSCIPACFFFYLVATRIATRHVSRLSRPGR